MLRYLLLIGVVLLSTAPAQVAHARLSGEDAEHARSAFDLSERRKWDDALAHARRSDDAPVLKLVQWLRCLDQDSGAGFEEISRFMEAHPGWPEQKRLGLRAEMALKNDDVPDSDVIAWFDNKTPITGVGKIALAEAFRRNRLSTSDNIKSLIRDAWKNGDFDESQEDRILERFSSTLTTDDHKARLDRLLWEERTLPARRILRLVPASYRMLYKARMALIENKRFAILSVSQVPASLKDDPGLIFNRMQFRNRRDDDEGVREMLLAAPDKPPYPEKWWKYREAQVRLAISEKDYGLAKKLLANHGQAEGQGLADALWIQGWLKTEFQNQPGDGLAYFEDMYESVKFPVSKARAAYWAGRALDKSGNAGEASGWYRRAAAYPTTFYGQLGWLKTHGGSALGIPSAPSVSPQDQESFERDDFVRAIKATIEVGSHDLSRRLITLAVENTDDPAAVALVTELGAKGGKNSLSVRAAKKALQQNIVLAEAGYPTMKTPSGTRLERPLMLAITRQESEFDPAARSPANAIGMMQLLPRTAREVARKNGVSFSASRLTEPAYNMTLGGHYLARLINSYDGSYIMAIAAYNAGPGNVRSWVKKFGTPGNDALNAINWIEKIPFSETRNYVQRVMENLQVYRSLENEGKLQIAEDLSR